MRIIVGKALYICYCFCRRQITLASGIVTVYSEVSLIYGISSVKKRKNNNAVKSPAIKLQKSTHVIVGYGFVGSVSEMEKIGGKHNEVK